MTEINRFAPHLRYRGVWDDRVGGAQGVCALFFFPFVAVNMFGGFFGGGYVALFLGFGAAEF